jgi:hypothetical protein
MKRNTSNGLIAQLDRIKANLDAFADPETRTQFLENLDGLIGRLCALRDQLTDAPTAKRLSDVALPLGQVISFLQAAKDDQTLAAIVSDALHSRPAKPSRPPISIPQNLTNDQIREFLRQDLSKNELKALAAQRGISVGKRTDEQVRRDLLRSLERQEGYQRLAMPRV